MATKRQSGLDLYLNQAGGLKVVASSGTKAEKRKRQRQKKKNRKVSFGSKSSRRSTGSRASHFRADSGRLALVQRQFQTVRKSLASVTGTRAALIARSYALPLESSPIRFKDVYTCRPTAVAHPRFIASVNFKTGSTGALTRKDDWPADGEYIACLSRNPLNFSVMYEPNPNNSVWEYYIRVGDTCDEVAWLVALKMSALDQPYAFFRHNGQSAPIQWPIPLTCAAVNPALRVPGGVTKTFGGIHKTRHGIWIDGALCAGVYTTLTYDIATLNILTGNPYVAAAGTAYSVVLYQLEGCEWFPVQFGQFVTDGAASTWTGTLNVAQAGYYAVELAADQNASPLNTDFVVRSTYKYSGICANYVHAPVPNLVDKLTTMNSVLIHAASLMVSSQAADFAANGMVRATQLQCDEQWTKLMGPNALTKMSSYNPVYNTNFKKGLYSFLKPCGPRDMSVVSLVCRDHLGRVSGLNAPLFPPGGWLVTTCAVVSASLAGAPDAAFAYTTVCAGVEYTTTDQWVDQQLPGSTTQEFAEAMEILSRIPQFHENPMHFSDVVNFLKNAGRTALRIAPSLLDALAPAMGKYGAAARLGAAGLSELNSMMDGGTSMVDKNFDNNKIYH